MKQTVSVLIFMVIIAVSGGLSCSQRDLNPTASNTALVLTSPQEWTPPIFPGAVPDAELQANITAVAATPEAIDETACLCFGFPVHDAVFYAYRANADTQDILDFHTEQMALEGWKKIAIDLSDPTLPQLVWQHGETGLLVAYLMVAPMEEGGTLIYLSIAERDSPQKIIGE